MSNEDKSIWVVYNGEIYNYIELRETLEHKGHIFASHSDTEVIIHAYEEWGEDCISHFNGMFAFSVWDSAQQKMLLARDRLGIKPLYYLTDAKRLVFASEIKALFQAGNTHIALNPAALLDYLTYQYALTDDTFFHGVKRLPPGYYLSVTNSSCRVAKYWDLPSDTIPCNTGTDVEQLQHRIRSLLTDSVRLRLRSDVDVGCYLSGGLDSSSITCLAASLSRSPIKTFTGKFSDGREYDESAYAQLVATHAGTDHNELTIDLTDVTSVLPDIIWYMDEPQAGSGVIPQYLISRLASKHLKVILGGQGADELFGGYGWYRKAIFAILSRRPGSGPEIFHALPASRFLWHYATHEGVLRVLESAYRFGLHGQPEYVYSSLRSIATQEQIKALLKPDIWESQRVTPQDRFLTAFDACRADNIFSQILKFDTKYYLPALLHVEDRASMAVSLESRLPFLDYRFVELSHRVPADLKIASDNSKHLLRESVKDCIPRTIYERKDKMGFPTPIEVWFKDRNSHLIRTYLLDKRAGISDILNLDHVAALWSHAQHGRRRAAEILWRCLAASLWYDTYVRNYSRVAAERLNSTALVSTAAAASQCVSLRERSQ